MNMKESCFFVISSVKVVAVPDFNLIKSIHVSLFLKVNADSKIRHVVFRAAR